MATDSTVRVGILHSLVGPLAISEVSLKDAELLAIAEINQAGGVLGQRIEPIIADGASEAITFDRQLHRLIQQEQVVTLFGCWLSSVRKFIIPTLEKHNALLWYPVQYEGLECSRNVFYTGSCPNQQIEPALQWLLQNQKYRFYLVGSNAVFSRTCHKIIRAHLKRKGGEILGDDYISTGGMDFRDTILRIKQTRPDVVFSTINSDSNLGFYHQYKEAGIKAKEIPILAISVTENEISQIGSELVEGHFAAHSYFQSLDTPSNAAFVQNFKDCYGSDRVTSDPLEAAYGQVYLWKQAVERAQSFEVDQVRTAAYGLTWQTPGSMVRIEKNHHLWKPCRIGKALPDGQFQIIQTTDELIKPQPWLGVDDVEFSASELVINMLAEASQSISYTCLLEDKSQELLKANQRLQTLTQRVELFKRNLTSQIRNSLELNRILTTAVHEIRSLLQIDRCQFLWQQTEGETVPFVLSHEALDPGITGQSNQSSVQDIPLLGVTILKYKLLQVDEVAGSRQLDYALREQLQQAGCQSFLAASLRTHSDRLGILICEQFQELRPWSEPEVELMQDAAEQLMIAIDQAELYDRARTTAIQAQTQAEQLQCALHNLKKTQAQLVQTEKMSSLGLLVAGIAHEINNPVNFIYGNLNYASDYASNLLYLIRLYQKYYPNPVPEIQVEAEAIDLDFLIEDLPKLLTSMQVGTERIRQIVLSLRNFSRLDESAMKPVNIHEGIDNTLLLLRNRLREHQGRPQINVIKDYGDLPLVECYAGQMNQVFMNILVNAIDALEEEVESSDVTVVSEDAGSVVIPTPDPKSYLTDLPVIHIQTKQLNEQAIAIHFHNNGPAIPQDVQKQLFDPFFTTKSSGKGTGLGLAISHQIVVDKHQGRLYCTSEPDSGTTFIIEIPIQPPPH